MSLTRRVPAWSPQRASAAAISMAAALACTVGCGDASPRSKARGDAGRPAIPNELRALGYGGWDAVEPSNAATSAAGQDAVEGVVMWDPARADPTRRLWADDQSTIHTIGADGKRRASIEVPGHTQVEFARALEGGRILALSVDEGVTLLEADGTVLWQIEIPCHHEITVAPRRGDRPGTRLFAVALHHARKFQGRAVRFDEVAFLEESSGRLTEDPAWPTWSTWERRTALERAVGGAAHPLSKPPVGSDVGGDPGEAPTYDYFHLNGIAFHSRRDPAEGAPSGGDPREVTMVICLRNVSLIAGVRLPSGDTAWTVGPDVLDWPHAPSILELPDGTRRLLAFDNGTHRGWSRVIEIDPLTGEITWDWRGPTSRPLWSRVRGFAERLPGGNTLVTESERGRVYEVARDGDVVWEFLNPNTRSSRTGTQRRRIYRMTGLQVGR